MGQGSRSSVDVDRGDSAGGAAVTRASRSAATRNPKSFMVRTGDDSGDEVFLNGGLMSIASEKEDGREIEKRWRD